MRRARAKVFYPNQAFRFEENYRKAERGNHLIQPRAYRNAFPIGFCMISNIARLSYASGDDRGPKLSIVSERFASRKATEIQYKIRLNPFRSTHGCISYWFWYDFGDSQVYRCKTRRGRSKALHRKRAFRFEESHRKAHRGHLPIHPGAHKA